MKNFKIAKICVAAFLALGLAILPANALKVQAEDMVVSGTIQSGTTSDMLVLSTDQGTMKIKIDSDTEIVGSKILLPEKKIYVSVTHGSDKYLHAVKITSDAQRQSVSVDSSGTYTVTGTIDKKTTDELIYFKTDQGTLQIKLDPTTNMDDCSILVMDKDYEITCARGSDKYLHALTISDKKSVFSTVNTNVATKTIKGKVTDKTKEELLYLSTDEGVMQFKIDSDADTRNGMVLTPDNKVTVSFYHGDDKYLHAAGIVGDKDSPKNVSLDSNTMTIDGTVEGKSTENMLYLDTSQGTMQMKLDAVESVRNCNVLVKGMKLTVTFARGSDAYMHALKITAR